MLEIPEARVIAKQLNETIRGKQVSEVLIQASPHKFAFFWDDPLLYPQFLKGKRIGESWANGGTIETTVEDYHMTFGDGVNLRFYDAQTEKPVKHQFYLDFKDGSALVATVAMYGLTAVFKPADNDNFYYLVAKEKPAFDSPDFDYDYFMSIVKQANNDKPSLSVKGLLATQQRIPGLGNGVAQDIMFVAGLHPKKKVASLSEADTKALFFAVKDVLASMIKRGGRDIEKDLFGNNGGYQTLLSNKTYRNPCPNCQGIITRTAFLGGNIYFCERCQIL